MNEIKSFESHITIEPVFGERFDMFDALCKPYKFKPAELLLQKNRLVKPERSNKDSFCTGHSTSYSDLLQRTVDLVDILKRGGFKVWRYKIEGILVDVKFDRLYSIEEV